MLSSDQFLIYWNNKFPKDRLFRKKYNIPFGSPEHRRINQIDVFLDIREDQLVHRHSEQRQKEINDLNEYKRTGSWMKEISASDSRFDEFFNSLDVSMLNEGKEESDG